MEEHRVEGLAKGIQRRQVAYCVVDEHSIELAADAQGERSSCHLRGARIRD